MQVGVVGQLADGPQVTARVARVLEAARRADVRVFFTRHMSLPTELMGVSQLRTAMTWQHKDRVEDVVSPTPNERSRTLGVALSPTGRRPGRARSSPS
jgi:nicotinamidase-related amidase